MKILSGQEIKNIERETIEAQGITSVELVERVGRAVADEIKALRMPGSPVLVFAGWGNNGADALETARLLAQDGYQPVVYLFNIGGARLSTECALFRDRLLDCPGVTLYEITGAEPFQWPEPTAASLIVDGLFGSGLDRPLPRSFQMLVRNINESGATVVSIDVPSGLFGDWNGNAPREDMIHATLTLAIEFPRMSFMLADNASVVGDWKVIRVGYDAASVKRAPFTFMLVDGALCSRFLVPRAKFAGKADFGHTLLFAGSRGMMGAAVLAARGALRSGAGKVTVHGPASGNPVVQIAVPAAMYVDDPGAMFITEMKYGQGFDAVAVGPGIGRNTETAAALERLVKGASAAGQRLVLDADALNIIADNPRILSYLTPLSVLTPHAGEFDRIFGKSDNAEERLKKAIRASEDYNVIIVLKGRYTAVVRPDGKIMFNGSGSPALATPGSGDVLTGVIAGLMGQGLASEIAAFVGPYVHGLAGEMAAARHGEYGVTAEDIANHIGAAINEIMSL